MAGYLSTQLPFVGVPKDIFLETEVCLILTQRAHDLKTLRLMHVIVIILTTEHTIVTR